MKKLNNKLANVLLNNKGEMLIETIISVMLFTVLIAGVTMMMTSATNGIRTTQRGADSAQETANMMMTEPETLAQDTNISVTLATSETADPTSSVADIQVEHSGKIISQEDMIYFYTAP